MKTLNALIIGLIIAFITDIDVFAQCDAALLREVQNSQDDVFDYLKTYDIRISNIEGVPMNKEFSYVLTKGAQYQFKLYQGADNQQNVKLKVFNSNKEEIPLTLIESNMNEESFHLFCEKTGIYFFIFYTAEAADACAVMQLNFLRYQYKLGKETKKMKFEDESIQRLLKNKHLSGNLHKTYEFILNKKEFVISDERGIQKKANYSYIFSKGGKYKIAVMSESKKINNIIFELTDAKKNKVILNDITKDDQHLIYDIKIDQTGIYFLNFIQKELTDDKIVAVLLKEN